MSWEHSYEKRAENGSHVPFRLSACSNAQAGTRELSLHFRCLPPRRIRKGLNSSDLPVGVDLGFQGIEKDFPRLTVVMPKKKPKGQELSQKDKRRNKRMSSLRVTVEHAIGGVKRFRTVPDVYRNLKEGFDDTVMVVACGLWNYHLNKT